MMRLWCAWLAAGTAAMVCAGCADYRWEQNIERAEQRAKAEGKRLCIYYWRYFDNDCNRMVADTINQPDVVQLFQGTINAQMCYDVPAHRDYMGRHGVGRAPAFLILAPDGTYEKRIGYTPKDAFVRWATDTMAPKGGERPAKPPPVSPALAP